MNAIFKSANAILAGAILTVSASAAPITPEQAMQEALVFLGQNSENGFNAPASLPIAYTAVAEKTPLYYIFNYQDGFVITTADDRLPAILGYSDCGRFDINQIPDNFRWWLSEYSREISDYLPTAPESDAALRHRKAAPRMPIEPMTKTTWNQGSPYNDDCPMVYGQRSVTGCVATAVSQIMKFHNWPLKPVGSNAGVTFSGTTYDWDNMLDNYEQGKYTAVQGTAVAKLMRQVGAGVNMQYSPYASGAYDYNVQLALPKYFGYDRNLTFYWKDYTPMKEWINIVYNELAEGRPLYYSGSSSEGGHAFVCDGYSENDYFHFNWGWGGYEDGYFLLSALNPASGGAGSYEGGYNRSQCIITGIKPAERVTAQTPTQSAILANGAFYYDAKENSFGIRGGSDGVSLIYNPLGYDQTLQFGLEILNPTTDTILDYIDLGEETIQPFFGFTAFTIDDMQTIPDGSYRLYLSYRKKKEEWKRVGIPLGMQNYVAMTAKNGTYTFTNNGPDSDYLPHLIIDMPEIPGVFYSGTDIAFHLPILNVGDGDFAGELGVSLLNMEDEFGDIGSYLQIISVPGKSFFNLPVVFNGGLRAGKYTVSIMDAEGNEYADNLSITVVDGDLPKPESDNNLISNLTPSFYTSETESSIYYTVTNTTNESKWVDLTFEFFDANTLKPVKQFHYDYSFTAAANSTFRLNIAPTDFQLQPGYYLYRAVDKNGTVYSCLYPMIVESDIRKSKSGVYYIITDEAAKTAVVVAPETGVYTNTTDVTDQLEGYTVTGIRSDAFAFSDTQAVKLGSNINRIPDGGFYCAKRLNTLTLSGNKMVEIAPQSFDPENTKNCWLNVEQKLIKEYRINNVWSNFRMPCWYFDLTNVSISGQMPEGYYDEKNSVLYTGIDSPFTLGLTSKNGKNIRYHISHNGEWIIEEVVDPVGYTLDLPALGNHGIGRVVAETTDEPVAVTEIDADSASDKNIYSIDGLLLIERASESDLQTLPAGIYLYGTEKLIIP